MYNNNINKSLTELYDTVNNKGQILLNNNNMLDYTLTEIKSYNKLNLNNNKIINLDTPVNDNDASNKLYVDSKTIKYSLISQNTLITQTLSTSMTKIDTIYGTLLTNNYVNSTYNIDTTDGTIKINESGYYDITITFDYIVDSPSILTLLFGLNNVSSLRKATNNETNKYRTIQFNTILNVTTSYNLSLYFKTAETITSNITVENLTFKILKL